MLRTGHAYVGASAEVEIASILDKELKPSGWRIEHNFNFPRHGDIDVVLLSPASRVYCIDVKSHEGTKQFINGHLVRMYNKNVYSFKEGDLLEKVRFQADYVSQLMNTKCTPILCFTQSDVDIKGNMANGIYVLSKSNLVDILKKLG
ncbi:hypothetical protein NIES2101_36910 [Calothrix sp. HK-06]|nr:hypothetical protein NIES2101_36910 [Calothrix sp. HK-06]